MAETRLSERGRILRAIKQYGQCIELVPLDPNFDDISVGLYFKDGVGTIWTFAQNPGVKNRVERIRDQLVALGGLLPVDGAYNQISFSCGELHRRPLRFLIMLAVEKSPDLKPSEGDIEIKDLKSDLILRADPANINGRWIYAIGASGEAKTKPMRIIAVTSGFVRYGEMEKLDKNQVAFTCGQRHDELMRLIISYARNVSGVQDMLEANALRGQMTTGTLGFSQT
ncbi:MAG: hypothetical protein QGF12_01585 [SAR202 cluster bacterium]|jgi:hypothetical protein|nr:hypothetical protein [SAR202 cluster bacterium]